MSAVYMVWVIPPIGLLIKIFTTLAIFVANLTHPTTKYNVAKGLIMQYVKENILKVKNLPIKPAVFTKFCNSAEAIAHDLQRACLKVGIGRLDTEKDMKVMVKYCNSLSSILRIDCWFGVAESYFPFHLADIGARTVCLSDEKVSQDICVHHLAQELGVFSGIEFVKTFCPQMTTIDKNKLPISETRRNPNHRKR